MCSGSCLQAKPSDPSEHAKTPAAARHTLAHNGTLFRPFACERIRPPLCSSARSREMSNAVPRSGACVLDIDDRSRGPRRGSAAAVKEIAADPVQQSAVSRY